MSDEQPLRRIMTLGDGTEIKDPSWIMDHMHEYMTFTQAAPLVHRTWLRWNLHREFNKGRIYNSQVLIVIDPQARGYRNSSGTGMLNHGKKYYITETEVKRLAEEHKNFRRHHKMLYCRFGCGRLYQNCEKLPCVGRLKDGREYQQTVEAAAEYFERFRDGAAKRKQHFSSFNRRGERKDFRNTKGKTLR